MNNLEDILFEVNDKKGKAGGWPKFINYSFDERTSTACLTAPQQLKDKKEFRQLDSWGMAFVAHVEKNVGINIERIQFDIREVSTPTNQFNKEAFLRRLSFLQLITGKEFTFIEANNEVEIYDKESLFNRPSKEIIRREINPRGDSGDKWSLEKDFQAFLYGEGFEKDKSHAAKEHHPNGRLAILGADFKKSNQKIHGILREFATGAFINEVKDENRILPTEYVDLVSLTTSGKLAVIELKIDDSPLEVISQTLDYALFFKCYATQIYALLNENDVLGKNIKSIEGFNVYMVSNVFHARMEEILPYYKTKGAGVGFSFKQVLLGCLVESLGKG